MVSLLSTDTGCVAGICAPIRIGTVGPSLGKIRLETIHIIYIYSVFGAVPIKTTHINILNQVGLRCLSGIDNSWSKSTQSKTPKLRLYYCTSLEGVPYSSSTANCWCWLELQCDVKLEEEPIF